MLVHVCNPHLYELRVEIDMLQATKIIEFDHSFTDEEKSLANALWLSCSLNNAACKLKLQEYSEVSRLCTKVAAFRLRN